VNRISGLVLAYGIVVVNICSAQSFHLKADGSAKLYGPFECKNGATVTIGSNTFMIVRDDKTSDGVATKEDISELKQMIQDLKRQNTQAGTVTGRSPEPSQSAVTRPNVNPFPKQDCHICKGTGLQKCLACNGRGCTHCSAGMVKCNFCRGTGKEQ
jgi:hypothetical protein